MDTVIFKAGYGTVTECVANGVPLIYVPYTSFAEYEALVAGMGPWGGVAIADEEFRAGRWRRLDADTYAVNGAQVIAARLEALF